ncbi:MAG: hypothetical protein ACLTDX_22680 [[Clostridium] innocuum]
MIYLSTIMSSDIWDLKALYEGANVQRLVASVTIMESLPIREWAKGGELLLTSSRTLPENEQDLLELPMICSACQPLPCGKMQRN